jgi:hypothetical protein
MAICGEASSTSVSALHTQPLSSNRNDGSTISLAKPFLQPEDSAVREACKGFPSSSKGSMIKK